eukprot:4411126-Amphidinium_carterae.1
MKGSTSSTHHNKRTRVHYQTVCPTATSMLIHADDVPILNCFSSFSKSHENKGFLWTHASTFLLAQWSERWSYEPQVV